MRPVLFALALLVATGLSQASEVPASRFTTLGTSSGPEVNAQRAQPANLLTSGGVNILVDAGDGASDALAKAGLRIESIQAILLTHLHFDHTGGLFAFLGRRWQMRIPGTLTIVGPPGTKKTVEGLLAAIQPAVDALPAMARANTPLPASTVKVVELIDGGRTTIGHVNVIAAVNTHDVLADEEGKLSRSLSYRFDLPDRSIVYTGDTGPSASVEKLAQSVDLLITEVMMAGDVLADLRARRPDVDPVTIAALRRHFEKQHLSPDEAGRMAARSGAKALVLTHIGLAPASIDAARSAIAAHFKGPIVFASDLQSY